MARIDETKIIDREQETATFASLIQFKVPYRVMVVTAPSGMGKTDLLRKFRLLANRDHAIPVSFVSFEEFENLPDEFAIVRKIQKALSRTGARMEVFESLNSHRELKNIMPFLEMIRDHQALVDLRNAIVDGAPRIAAFMVNAENFSMPAWDAEADTQARWVCVKVFFDELTSLSSQQPVVLLFDGLEKVGDEVRDWLISEFVRSGALSDVDKRKLLVVLAGTDAQDMVLGRLSPGERGYVEPLPPFAVWDEANVRDCLRANGISNASDQEVTACTCLLKAGHDLMYVISQAENWVRKRGGH